MKRAEVWQIDGEWVAGIDRNPCAKYRGLGRLRRIAERTYALPDQQDFSTHAAALAYALAEVGLTETNTREDPTR